MCAKAGFFGCLIAGKLIPAFTGVVIEKLNIAYVWHTDYSVPKAIYFHLFCKCGIVSVVDRWQSCIWDKSISFLV